MLKHQWVQYGGQSGFQTFPGRKTYYVCRACGVVKTSASAQQPCIDLSARPTAPSPLRKECR